MQRLIVLPGALKAWRAERGISQENLAAAVGCSSAFIALVETERRQPSRVLLEKIAEHLGVDPGALAFLPTAAELDAAS